VIAENMSARVEATMRAVKVEAFIVWSAYRTNVVSITSASSCEGSMPSSMWRKFAAWGSFGLGGTISCPVRIRWYMASRVGVFEIRRSALRRSASAESSHPSGSYAEAADTLVRSIDIGEVCWARVGIRCWRNLETSRSSTMKSLSASSSRWSGSRSSWSRCTTSSYEVRPARSWMS
jgi:hypothetical protein